MIDVRDDREVTNAIRSHEDAVIERESDYSRVVRILTNG
jgi:hypothetical protein